MANVLNSEQRARAGRRRITLKCLAFTFIAALVLPLAGYVYSGIQEARAQEQGQQAGNPRADYWRAVRKGNTGYSAVTGKLPDGTVLNAEGNTLIQSAGQNWRQYRNGVLANYGGWGLFLVLIAVLAYFALKGRIELASGRSGMKVKRWSAWDRVLHWCTAVLFVILAVTGLSLLFGRLLLIPLLGPKGFALWASAAKSLHDISGPLFSVGVLLMIATWVQHNLPKALDFAWIAKGGGLLGNNHPSAGRLNAGEKIWFWFIATIGLAVIVSGFVLNFPTWDLPRQTMQLANLIHGGLALLWVAFWMGHAYIGTVGTEGALEGMTTGYVDVNWAKQHHDLWYEEEMRGQEIRDEDSIAADSVVAAAAGGAAAVSARASRWIPEDSVLRRHYESALASGSIRG